MGQSLRSLEETFLFLAVDAVDWVKSENEIRKTSYGTIAKKLFWLETVTASKFTVN